METNKKAIGNAISAYFMFFICLSFLWSKNSNINHPFVRNHVKTAIVIQSLLMLSLIIMGFGIGGSIILVGYSLNTIITILLCLFFFGCLGYGAYKAHLGESVTSREIFKTSGMKRNFLSETKNAEYSEETKSNLIFGHVPFIGYIVYGRNREVEKLEDITFFNLLITIFAVILSIFGYLSLASILMLAYIVWSVYQSIRLVTQNEMTTLDLSVLPSPERKYIIQKSMFMYVYNMLFQKTFVSLSHIIDTKYAQYKEKELQETQRLLLLKESTVPSFLFYIPFINIIGLGFFASREQVHIKNGLTLTFIFVLIILFFGVNSYLLVLLAIPVFYGIGYHTRLGYHMPYIYDIHNFFTGFFSGIARIFRRTKKLQQTVKSEKITITKNETITDTIGTEIRSPQGDTPLKNEELVIIEDVDSFK
ncbi:hypothetical protein GW846_05600 [Candidatus Gracilibacteria bacterium]|nr:hypothetical protein [Candidatus Gracilibacteria bacterium]